MATANERVTEPAYCFRKEGKEKEVEDKKESKEERARSQATKTKRQSIESASRNRTCTQVALITKEKKYKNKIGKPFRLLQSLANSKPSQLLVEK